MSYVEKVFGRPAQLPSLGDVVVELSKLTEDEDAGARRLAIALGKDQAMSAKLLRLANSASYGSRGKVDTIDRAIGLVGLRDFRVFVLASGALSATAKAPGLDLVRHLQHSNLTARFAVKLAELTNQRMESAYVAGLLHTIGIPLMHIVDGQVAVEIAREAEGRSYLDRIQIERELLGSDHAEIGAELLRRWRMPDSLVRLIGSYQDAEPTAATHAGLLQIASSAASEWISGAPFEQIAAKLEESLSLERDAVLELGEFFRGAIEEAGTTAAEISDRSNR